MWVICVYVVSSRAEMITAGGRHLDLQGREGDRWVWQVGKISTFIGEGGTILFDISFLEYYLPFPLVPSQPKTHIRTTHLGVLRRWADINSYVLLYLKVALVTTIALPWYRTMETTTPPMTVWLCSSQCWQNRGLD